MKLGILTVFDNENFGNRLQNYALQQVLLGYGDTVVTIKNKPRFRSFREFLRRGTPLAESVFLNRLLGKRRKAKILSFHQAYIRTSRRCYCCGKTRLTLETEDRCDGYCIGSDQVWNPDLGRTGGFSFASFAQGKAFSYAASFGVETLPTEMEQNIRVWLQKLPHLSVREEAGKRILENLLPGRQVQVHIDPTLLLPKAQWEAMEAKPKASLPETYLLLYFLGNLPPERRRTIWRKAARLGLSVIDLMDPKGPFYESGPEEFLYLIHHADLVYTDSFHASVFSFLFGRSFLIFDREGTMGSRLDTFTQTFHLEGCRVRGSRIPEVPKSPDYSAGFATLEAERNRSKAYLDSVFHREDFHGP